MKIRKFNALMDYKDVCSWWEAHKWPSMPLSALSTTGFVTEKDGKKLCAGWLYRTDSTFCLIEWIISNPDSDKIERGQALDMLIETVAAEAKAQGFEFLFTTVQHAGLIRRYESKGFAVTDKDMTSLIRRL